MGVHSLRPSFPVTAVHHQRGPAGKARHHLEAPQRPPWPLRLIKTQTPEPRGILAENPGVIAGKPEPRLPSSAKPSARGAHRGPISRAKTSTPLSSTHDVSPAGKFCYCGQKGCAYCYVNTRILSDAGGTLEGFFRQLRKGDPDVRAVWDRYLGDLALLINNIRCAYDCEVVVGGYLAHFLPLYLDDLRALTAMRNIFERSGQYVRCAQKDAGAAKGAALTCLHSFIEEI